MYKETQFLFASAAGDKGGEASEVLQEAKVDVYTQEYCRKSWGSAIINDGHICVGVWGQVASCSVSISSRTQSFL